MSPRIDPALPLVWRTPVDLQLGATTPRVVIRDAGDLETGLIAALRHGASVETLCTIGSGLGGEREEVLGLVAALEPAFEATQPSPARTRGGAAPIVVVDADDALTGRLGGDLLALGYRVLRPGSDGVLVECAPTAGSRHDDVSDDAPGLADTMHLADSVDLVVIVAPWVVPPARHLPWLRRDIPHLAVVFDDSGTRIGPLVEPGSGPCLRCIDLDRRDHDAAWPVIAAQLAGRAAATCTTLAAIEATAVAVAVIDDRLRRGSNPLASASLRLSRERPAALPRLHRHEPHPECGCRAPGGISTAPARLDAHRRPAPTTASAAAVPA
jgi:hypothetical protein